MKKMGPYPLLHRQPLNPVQITMSNWEERILGEEQVRYAVLDALIPGAVFRQLRVWHATNSSLACTSCDNGRAGKENPNAKKICL